MEQDQRNLLTRSFPSEDSSFYYTILPLKYQNKDNLEQQADQILKMIIIIIIIIIILIIIIIILLF